MIGTDNYLSSLLCIIRNTIFVTKPLAFLVNPLSKVTTWYLTQSWSLFFVSELSRNHRFLIYFSNSYKKYLFVIPKYDFPHFISGALFNAIYLCSLLMLEIEKINTEIFLHLNESEIANWTRELAKIINLYLSCNL